MWSTITSWLALLAFAAVAANYYNPNLLKSILPRQREVQSAVQEAAKLAGKKPKSQRLHNNRLDGDEPGSSPLISATEGQIPKKRKIISAPIQASVKATTVKGQSVSLPRDEDGGMSTRDFAQQLAKAQAGTNLESSNGPGTSKKDRRAAKATQSGHESPGLSTEDSSVGGRDADDDLSPNVSPPSGAVSTAPTSRAGDVSDMLEAPAPKPSTLRLTDVKETPKPQSSAKAFETVMTKKQRQRKAKQEENKLLRDEADRIQEAKKQAQLRSARMAAGTSNQTKANTFASTRNAWQNGKTSDAVKSSVPNHTAAPLLDTFDAAEASRPNGAVSAEPMSDITNGPTKNVSAVRAEVGREKTGALAASNREHMSRPTLTSKTSWADQVNEEEQNSWAHELVEEEKWESVTNKKSKKKSKKDADTSSEASSSIVRAAPTGISAPVTNGTQTKSVNSKPPTINRFQSMEQLGGGGDGDWEA